MHVGGREVESGSELGLGVLIGMVVGISLTVLMCVLAVIIVLVHAQYRKTSSMKPVQTQE